MVLLSPLAVALALALGAERAPLVTLRNVAFDRYQVLRPRPRTSAPVVIVEIDDASLAKDGQWPWQRTSLAKLLDAIAADAPAAIGMDVVMPEADRLSPSRLGALVPQLDPELAERLKRLTDSDAALAAAVARHRVVLGIFGVEAGSSGVTTPMRHTPWLVIGGPVFGHVHTFGNVLRSIKEIDIGAAGWGLVNPVPGEPVVRRLPLVSAVGDVLVPSLGVEILRMAVGERIFKVHASRDGVNAVEVGRLRIRTQPDGTAFVPYGVSVAGRYVSAADVLSGRVPARRFEDQFVLVGVTAVGVGNLQATPVAARMSGIEIHAQWLESVLERRLLLRPWWARWAEAGAVLAAGAVLLVALPTLPMWGAALVTVILLAAFPIAGFLVYLYAGLLLDAASSTLGLSLVAATLTVVMLAEVLRQRRLLREQLQRQREEAAKTEGELEAARRIQMGGLPTGLAGEHRVTVYAFLRPAGVVGGDLYDFFKLDADHLFFVVADVSGSGVAASVFMAVSKALCKSAALRRGNDIGAIIRDAHADISRDNPEALFVSVWAGLLDLRTGELQHCNAGHEPAWLVGLDAGSARILEAEGGPPLCVVDRFPYAATSYRMRPGETLCLVTDGVTEAEDGARRLYGRQRLAETLSRLGAAASPSGLGEAIRSDVTDFVAGNPASDDLTILILQWHGNATATLSEP